MAWPPRKRLALFILGVLYAVGVVGMYTPALRPLVLPLTPITLCITVGLLLWVEGQPWRRSLPAALAVGVLGYSAEVLGVHGGWLFGHYHYGSTLGPKLFEVPLSIAINWMLLVHAAVAMLRTVVRGWLWVGVLGALLITAIDALIEPLASAMDFWHWQDGHIPTQNFIGWLGVGTLLCALYAKTAQPTERGLSRWVLLLQAGFVLAVRSAF